MPQDVLYIEGLLRDNPTYHQLVQVDMGSQTRGYWARTICGLSVSFRSECAVMLADHARKIAAHCEGCARIEKGVGS